MSLDTNTTSRPDSSDEENPRRHWYDLRPEPRGRADFMGYNYTWWTVLGAVIIVVLAIFPW